MSGFLEQIERRQQQMQETMEQKQADKTAKKAVAADPNRPKTVGVKVPPAVYAKLVHLKEAHGLGSIKDALLFAAEAGLTALGTKK